jgi:hypothetical protein
MTTFKFDWRPQPDLNRCCPAWNAGCPGPLHLMKKGTPAVADILYLKIGVPKGI